MQSVQLKLENELGRQKEPPSLNKIITSYQKIKELFMSFINDSEKEEGFKKKN